MTRELFGAGTPDTGLRRAMSGPSGLAGCGSSGDHTGVPRIQLSLEIFRIRWDMSAIRITGFDKAGMELENVGPPERFRVKALFAGELFLHLRH